ncbi:gluconokinase [Coleofasciculus sp. FACHB-SPT36]|uniref:gluconokinase n=1 Tax=Cyanophyceae TaxID=3028117 RepID=UPI00168AE0A9|nr:gluconokinase [Coleofasciculus sp. FACHB-SPT36]MBD2537707.1 gluconokinase [Coleofasciculus sp. FACHB-SPT36]
MIILVMGVSGSGKSTVAQLLGQELNWDFSDADCFHTIANIEKMSRGIPLTDADRMPWLQAMQHAIDQWLQEGKNQVLACSALKESYRQMLWRDPQQMRLVYLKGSFEAIAQRLEARQSHFMTKTLLQSQFDTLEEPQNALWVDVSEPLDVIVQQIRKRLEI